MIDGLKPYPAMKDSGVPWLGEVPKHWASRRIKQLARPGYKTFVDGDWIESPHITSEGIRLIQTGNIGVGAYREKGFRYIAPSTFREFCCTEFHPNDVLICRLGEPVGRACLAPNLGVRMITSVDVCILKAGQGAVPAYLVYAMSSTRYLGWVNSLVRGSTRDRVSRSMLGSFLLPLPPLREQAAIVRFLDHADRRIRRYIRARQKLIKLLEEQKQAIIHRAVTRGLDPNVRLKPSGVEWLGEVPEHWEVEALRHRYSQVLGKMLDSKRITGESLLPYLRNTDVQWDRINVDSLPQMDIAPAEYERYTVRAGDLLVCEGGEVGRAAIWTGSLPLCGFQKALHRLRPFNPERDVPRFLYFALRAAAKGNAFSDGHVSTIAHLTGEKLRGYPFPFPPREEQRAIARGLDVALVNIGSATECAARQITLLREFRTRLIADVVTGKLDVREAAARLPDLLAEASAQAGDAEEPEPFDEFEAEGDTDEAGADDTDAVPAEAEA